MVLNVVIYRVDTKLLRHMWGFNMNISYVHGLIGGAFIGAAAVILFWFNGRIMGVSGITSKLLSKPDKDFWWRLAFVLGLIFGGYIYQMRFPVAVVIETSGWGLIVAGFLVGFGTVIGNGCTSGHGICGLARLSKRSIVATIVFMAAGILTVWVKKTLGV
ncbi:MAG: YeeE/YedE family protein [Candidatus Omnitrophica bacterium]|nr:YeeE/YedE family protein [Candidatus Omnitrophota bacterium]